ncbi:hypothetical protein AX16_000943 [Volvariella volvacea WC 439]|nr:hypothetical protein AX16_000943 [Volvariella volvacea WC 439]
MGLRCAGSPATMMLVTKHRFLSFFTSTIPLMLLIDPLDFDCKCDGSLPLEDMISFNPKLRKLFEDIDRSRARVWALTNAYKPHAERVLRILGLQGLVDGLVYCDYNIPNFSCKPEPAYYQAALEQAGVPNPAKCYFVDDSLKNVKAAIAQGWGNCVHFNEVGLEIMEGGKMKALCNGDEASTGIKEISNLEELREVWPEIFKGQEANTD